MPLLKAQAKVNLRLKVLRKRSDHYHELDMYLVPVTLCDDIAVTYADRLHLTCNWPDIPLDESNIVHQALGWWSRHTGRPVAPLRIHLEKRIPIGAGLGGGSSDAAAILLWLAAQAEMVWNDPLFNEVAFKVGADVPFFLRGVPARVRGIGERFNAMPRLPVLSLLVVKPDLSISTRWAYEEFDKLTRGLELDSQTPSFNGIEDLGSLLENDLEAIVVRRYPVVGEVKAMLENVGARWAMMTGSGAAVFGIFMDERLRDRASGRLRKLYPRWQIFPTQTLPNDGDQQGGCYGDHGD